MAERTRVSLSEQLGYAVVVSNGPRHSFMTLRLEAPSYDDDEVMALARDRGADAAEVDITPAEARRIALALLAEAQRIEDEV